VPDEPSAAVTDTAVDLIPVREDPAADVVYIAPGRTPPRDVHDAPVAGASEERSVDLAPARGDPARDITDTAFDLAPVRDVPAGPGGPASRVRGGTPERAATERPATAPATRAPAAPRRRLALGDPYAGHVASTLPDVIPERPDALRPAESDRFYTSRRLADPRRLAASRRPAGRGWAWRPVAGGTIAGALLATVIPLCLLQVPYAPLPLFAGAGARAAQAGGPAGLLRAASLALPFAVAAAPLAALAVRRLRSWPVLLAGLLIIVAAGWLSGLSGAHAGQSGALAAMVGALRGIGAGLAIPATVAVVTDHVGLARRLLAACWAAVVVAALAVLPALGTNQPAGWRAALGPVPWLTIAALVAAVLYTKLAGGPLSARRRGEGAVGRRAQGARVAPDARVARPYAGPTRLAVLVPAAAALGVIAAAVTYRPSGAIVVVAVCGVAGLLVMAFIAVRGARGDGFALTCALAGFFLAPASAALAGLRAMAGAGAPAGTVASGTLLAAAAVAGALAGAATALAGRPVTAILGARAGLLSRAGISLVSPGAVFGLLLAAGALVAASMTGPFAGTAMLAVLVAAVTGGLTAALAREARQVSTGAAMTGAVILAAGALAGYLAAAAVRVELAGIALAGPIANPAGRPTRTGAAAGPDRVPHGLVAAVGWWELAAATVAVLVVFVWCARGAAAEAALRWHPRHDRRNAVWRANQGTGRGDPGTGSGIDATTGWGADEGADGTDQGADGARPGLPGQLRKTTGPAGAAGGRAANGERGGRRTHPAHG